MDIAAGAWQTAVAMVGKFCVAASFSIVYIYSAEIFPTSLRYDGPVGTPGFTNGCVFSTAGGKKF